MKRLSILLISAIIATSFCAAQTPSYTPINLDTSCYWIQKYRDYHSVSPAINIIGEVLHYVEKDTLVGTNTYQIVRGYPSAQPVWTSEDLGALVSYICYNPKIFIREDMAAKKIYMIYKFSPLTETLLLNYNLLIGDSVSHLPPDSSAHIKYPVDSIRTVNYFGVNRTSYFANSGHALHAGYVRIEGVGANMNFPHVLSGQFDEPIFRLGTFIKNNTVLYKDSSFSIDSCYRKANLRPQLCWPLGTYDTQSELGKLTVHKNLISLESAPTNSEMYLLSIDGSLIFKEHVASGFFQKDISYLPQGVYILRIQTDKWSQTKKVFVQ